MKLWTSSRPINRVYEHLENGHLEKAVMACMRLARMTRDNPGTGGTFSIIILRCEVQAEGGYFAGNH